MSERGSRRVLHAAVATLAVLPLCACGTLGPSANPQVSESTPAVLAAADPLASEPALILQPESVAPAPLHGRWQVATGGRNCTLTLIINQDELAGETAGCSKGGEVRPIAIGLVSGGSFLFQTGRGEAGWIWSGRYDTARAVLEGRREHVITGELESFVARR